MGLVYADLTITNSVDSGLALRGMLKKHQVRAITTKALVDSGAYMMCINEDIVSDLGLNTIDEATVELADGRIEKLKIAEPVDIYFKNRATTCRAAILPANSEVLLGSIPMEDLDVVIVPKKNTIDVNPESPDMAKKKLKKSN